MSNIDRINQRIRDLAGPLPRKIVHAAMRAVLKNIKPFDLMLQTRQNKEGLHATDWLLLVHKQLAGYWPRRTKKEQADLNEWKKLAGVDYQRLGFVNLMLKLVIEERTGATIRHGSIDALDSGKYKATDLKRAAKIADLITEEILIEDCQSEILIAEALKSVWDEGGVQENVPAGPRLELDEGRKQESAGLDPVSNSGPLINNSNAAKWMNQYLMDHSTTSAYLPTIKAVTENARVIEKLLTFARRDRDLSDFAKTYDQMLMDDLGDYWMGWRLYLADHGLWTGEDLNWETRQLILNAILNKVLNERAASHSSLLETQSPPADSPKSKKKSREPNEEEKKIIDAINTGKTKEQLCIELDLRDAKPRESWDDEFYKWPKGPNGYQKVWNTKGKAAQYWHRMIAVYVQNIKRDFRNRIKVTKSPR